MDQWVKNLPAMQETQETVLTPGWARSPGGGSDNPLQHSCLRNLQIIEFCICICILGKHKHLPLPHATTKSSLYLLKPEKAPSKQQRPSAAKNK